MLSLGFLRLGAVHAAADPLCTVNSVEKGNYTALQDAVADHNCTTISRSLTLQGTGTGSTIVDGNRAGTVISITAGSLVTISDVTIQNGKATNGGGLFIKGILTLINSTIVSNTASAGGGIITGKFARVTLKNTLLANTGGNCFGPFSSAGHNLSSDATCTDFIATGDITNTNPLLGPLQANGGATLTQALLPGSPAIDAGDDKECPVTDQRGIKRPQGGYCDIGAYEYEYEWSRPITRNYLPFAGQHVIVR
ncbi:MAG: hypothetical protein EXR62_05530 [Chloroflexi bacterium]|nr:hypothetical protein [Chloroflexota bacterium]